MTSLKGESDILKDIVEFRISGSRCLSIQMMSGIVAVDRAVVSACKLRKGGEMLRPALTATQLEDEVLRQNVMMQ